MLINKIRFYVIYLLLLPILGKASPDVDDVPALVLCKEISVKINRIESM